MKIYYVKITDNYKLNLETKTRHIQKRNVNALSLEFLMSERLILVIFDFRIFFF